MGFSGGAKRICNKLLKWGSISGRQYSTSVCRKASFFSMLRNPRTSVLFTEANLQYGRVIFLRRFSFEVPVAADQMNLTKQLRERTSAPIKDVKAALVKSNWDIEVAQKELRRRGMVLASKKLSHTAAEGLLALAQSESKAAFFLASFWAFHFGPESLEELTLNLEHPKINGETTVQNAITEVAAMMGENVRVRRGFVMSTSSKGVLSTYLHTSPQPDLGCIAGILSLEVDDAQIQLDAFQFVGSELTMHVVATKSLFLTKEHVSSDASENEPGIL
ncbi:Elongation factor Ts, mitochondrial [Quillaja saponaria]|uniref:Elongation factor Ts, mitochondrial n=1 Tax=Quillaja saponaria TaxID=32244 RepID=A0AAD7VHL8_QUISA|nr:Elongation factor Ts, mitochondrial [Quillaja saponaria]